MRFLLKIANFCAKHSVKKYNSCRVTRVLCRAVYQFMAAMSILHNPEHYPWPYCDPQFPGFEEDDDALVADVAEFVIRRSPSYMIWKIWQTTGKILHKRKGRHCHAKRWCAFLESYGFQEADIQQNDPRLHSLNSHYIGVSPDEGEFGQLYWLEGYGRQDDFVANGLKNHWGYVCSTYRNFREVREWVDIDRKDIIWYKIC